MRMWTLLSAAASYNGFQRTSRSPERTNGALPTNGAASAARIASSAKVAPGDREVCIYMHPGRMAVGRVDLERADEQFDLEAAESFTSLDEAEPACEGRTGFLLELRDVTANGGGDDSSVAVLFVEGLRG
jgi:hypothetical protein